MERLHERLSSAENTLAAFGQIVVIETPNDIERDTTIQRFKFTFQACWKAAKQHLYDIEGIDIGSPESVIRSYREINLYSDEETILGLNMVNDRNLTVHTYNEEVAVKMPSNFKNSFSLLSSWVERMKIVIK